MPFDPADLWERYCAEVPDPADQSPQGAMAFACEHLLARHAQQPTLEQIARAISPSISHDVLGVKTRRAAEAVLALVTFSSTEAPVAQQPSNAHPRTSSGFQAALVYRVEHDGFAGTEIGSYTTREGKQGAVLQQIGSKVVHVYNRKHLIPLTDEGLHFTGAVPAAQQPSEIERAMKEYDRATSEWKPIMPRDYKHDCPCPHHPFECFGHPNTCPCATEAVAWQWRYVGEDDWKTPSGGAKLTPEQLERERPIEQRPLFCRS